MIAFTQAAQNLLPYGKFWKIGIFLGLSLG